jgi:signal transduction histidine kinase
MSMESSSGGSVERPAWRAETYSALADALLTEDADRCRRLLGGALESDAAFAAWAYVRKISERVRDSRQLAEHLTDLRGQDIPTRLLDALRLRHAVLDWEKRFATALDDAKLAALAEFAAGAGHEMNNPLAVISGRAQLLLRGEQDETRRADLALIKAQATRVHEMIADLMLFARPPQPVQRPTDLGELLRSMAERLRETEVAENARIVLNLPDAPVVAEVDPAHLAVAVRALVENGLRSAGDGGRVTVVLDSTPHPTITVRDNGPGITPAERPLIFDPYYSGRQAGRGLGMGLPKAWRIIQLHGGSLTVGESAEGGASFIITLKGVGSLAKG